MDNTGLVTLNFGMNVANSHGSATSQILHQLPGIQQVFTHNAPIKSGDGTQNVVQQTVLPVNNSPQTGNPTVLAAATGLQFVGQPGPGFLGPQQQQPQLLTQPTGTQQILGPRSMYATNYQIMPRNFTVFNQGIQGPAGVAVQLSPQQMGTATLSPMEQQQQFFQSAGFDSQLGTLQQPNQQQITFQNANCQFMIQNPSQQLMLQSPNQQFALPSPSQQFTVQNQNQYAVQGHNIAQFNPQHQILTQGQGNNVIVQNQAGSMILQGDNFVSQGLSQNVFVPNQSLVQNVNPQVYGTAQNVLSNQIPGLISQAQVVANQNVGIISVSHSLPVTPNGSGDKSTIQTSAITNEQMQLLAHIANHGNDVNNPNLPNQHQLVQQVTSQNQSLPSFGHFLLHHHMQSLPHPFLQNLSISTMATEDGSRKQLLQAALTVSPPTNPAGLITVSISSNSVPTTLRNRSDNINEEFNNWNIGQFVNQSGVNPNSVASTLNTQQSKGADVKLGVLTLCSKVSNSVNSTQVVTATTNVLSKGVTSPKVISKEELSGVRPVSMAIDSVKPSHDKSPQTVIANTHTTPSRNTIVVPFGWVRALEGTSIVYYSPTCTRLTSTDSVKQYLSTDGTCKCGLECPLHVDRVFNFNSDVISIKWNPSFSNIKDAGNPCNHKRKYSAISSSQPVRTFGITRPEVSMVTSSGLMSPRVSSTVQETQALVDGNKRRKVVQDESLHPSNDANSSFVDLTSSVKDLSESPVTDNAVSINCKSEKTKTTADKTPAGDEVVSTCVLNSNNVTESGIGDKSETVSANKGKSDMQKVELSEKTDSGRLFLKDISRNIPKQLAKKSDIVTSSNKKIDVICSRLSSVISGGDSLKVETVPSLKSPTSAKTDGKLLSPKSSSRSSSRGSAQFRHGADQLSPRSERNAISSKLIDRALASAGDQRFTAEMFSHFMNFCGLTDSNIPPMLPQNVVGIPDSDTVGKDMVQTGSSLVNDALKSDLMKFPMIPQSPFGPLQANILANLHKLTSPPNQQVFPSLNLPGLSHKHSGGGFHHDKTSLLGSPHSMSGRPGSVGSISSTLSVSTAGLISPTIVDIILPSPGKKTKGKKSADAKVDSSKNIESLFDSDEPPPNVDVSQLKDKGHGPIPKEKIASFIDNSSEFTKQHSDLMSKSISSTTSSLATDCSVSKETCQVDSQSEKTRSDSACSDRLNSPCPMDKDVIVFTDDVSTSDTLPNINPTALYKDSSSYSTSSSLPNSGSKACVSLINQLSSTTSVVQTMPAASAPPTPTTVVHHTPGSLSCHQMSLIKARQHALGLKDSSKDPSTENLINPLAAILSDPTIGQVFQQMFPEVAQQVLMHSLDMHKPMTQEVPGDLTTGLKHKKPSSTVPLLPDSHGPACSTTPLVSVPFQKPGFSMQPLIGGMSQGEFPASNLLSAAAKAQLEFQQNQFGMLMAQQLRGSLPSVMVPNQIPPRNAGIPTTLHNVIHSTSIIPTVGMSVTPPFGSVSKQRTVPVTTVTYTNLDTSMTSSSIVNDKVKPKVGAQKISELLNRTKSMTQPEVEMTNLINLLQKPAERTSLHGNDLSKISHILQGSQAPGTTLSSQTNIPGNMNPLMAPLGHLMSQGQGHNVDMSAVNPQLLQMYNTLGIPINLEMMNQKPIVRPAGPPVESTVQRTSINQLVAPSGSQFASNVTGTSASVPLLIPQPDLSTTGIVPNTQQFVPVIDTGNGGHQVFNLHGIQPANMQGLLQPTHFSMPTMTIANDGLIARQLNPSMTAPASMSETPHNQLLISNNLLGGGSASSTPDVINLLNMQHGIGSGTHLTAMQLQTLQLQQQLLQQLQQVQGMQNLISQYNLHNVTNTTTVGPPKKEPVIPHVAHTPNDTSSVAVVASPTALAENSNVHSTNNSSSNDNKLADNESTVSGTGSKSTSTDTDGQTRKSCNIRVIAAADTTEDCSTKTVDIGTVTDAFVEDNSESEMEEPANSECDHTTSKSDEDVSDDANENSETGEEKVKADRYNVSTENQVDSKSLSPVVSSASRKTTANTCLAIATQKGNSRSSEIESRVLEKSSLARSQNLSAELTKPAGGELKLRIKRKHLLHGESMHDVQSGQRKRMRMKDRKSHSQSYLIVKKALRSSTVAATKASSSLAAKYSSKDKFKDLVKRSVKPTAEVGGVVSMSTSPSSKPLTVLPTSSSESYECDSSIDSQTGSLTEAEEKDYTEKDSITSRIAAALSSQKGLWQLSNLKKVSSTDESTSTKATCSSSVGETGRKRTRSDNMVDTEKNEAVSEKSPSVSCTFNTGDLVWGQIRGFPSWPGKLVEDTELKNGETVDQGKVLVKWFGDNTITQVEPNKLKTLSEGLEAHHRARKKHRRGRKMNSNLEQAIQHAMTELDRQAAATDTENKTSNVSDMAGKSAVKVKQKK